jgi:hypothetical protein
VADHAVADRARGGEQGMSDSAGTVVTVPAPPPPPPRGPGPRRWLAQATEFVYRLAGSTLATPRVAVGVSLTGLILIMLVGILSPNFNTLPPNYSGDLVEPIILPLSGHLFSLSHWFSIPLTYLAIILQCLGLAGLLWANSRGWQPKPGHLFLGACVIVGIMVNITPVGSSDTTSYAAYGHMANRGFDPYSNDPEVLGPENLYFRAIGPMWNHTESVYGPLATWTQQLAAWIGGNSPGATIHYLMIFNGLVFLATGYYLLKVADDPVRACLMWVANPVLIQQLVAGGHLDTYAAAGTVVAVHLARRSSGGSWRWLWVGVAVGVACSFKMNAALVGAGIAFALMTRREWGNIVRLAVGGIGTVALAYSYYGLHAFSQLLSASNLVANPSPWRLFQLLIQWSCGWFGHTNLGITLGTKATNLLWPILMIALAVYMYRKFSSDQPAVVTVPFVLCFAWIVVAPWTLPWYSALAWVILALLPRNPMTRWLTLATVYLSLMHSSGGTNLNLESVPAATPVP